ncbi:hypothetical protein PF003_g13822 [Phytophthora fragariae]|nr:hypothetical protein PF003_g13822 [Phytophthora fragariae]
MVCEGVVVRQENLQIDKVRVQAGQTAYLRSGLLLMKLFLTICVLVVQVLNPKPVGWAAAVVWALVAQPTRQASLWRVHEGVVVRQEDVQINKVLNLTAVGCGTALAWAPVARLVTQASLEVVEEGVAHEGAWCKRAWFSRKAWRTYGSTRR